MPEGRLHTILSGSQPYTNEIVQIGKRNFVLNSAPMNHEGQRLGTLVTFQSRSGDRQRGKQAA